MDTARLILPHLRFHKPGSQLVTKSHIPWQDMLIVLHDRTYPWTSAASLRVTAGKEKGFNLPLPLS